MPSRLARSWRGMPTHSSATHFWCPFKNVNVCMYVFMYVDIVMYIHLCVCNVNVCMYVCMYVDMIMFIHLCVCIRI